MLRKDDGYRRCRRMRPEALGDLMQGSRQGFYRGSSVSLRYGRLGATLKADLNCKNSRRRKRRYRVDGETKSRTLDT